MNPTIKTIRKFAILVVALALTSGQTALAQATTAPEQVASRIKPTIANSSAALAKYEVTLKSAEGDLDKAWDDVLRIEQSLNSKRPPRGAFNELMQVSQKVATTRKTVSGIAKEVSGIQGDLRLAMSLAEEYQFTSLFRYAAAAMSVSEDVASHADSNLNTATKLAEKIERIASRMPRG
jgi:hypothetical protein